MNNIDLATLRDRICELADVYGAKHPTEHALRVWFHTLREFAIGEVAGFLIEWPKHGAKMPSPSDCWKRLNDRRTEDIEKKALAEKAQFERDAKSWTATPVGKSALAALKHSLKSRPRETIAEKCLRNSREAMRRHESGEFVLPPWVLEHHKARVASSTQPREPGSDFEEDAVREVQNDR